MEESKDNGPENCNPLMQYETVQKSAEYLKTKTRLRPELGIIAGTGLSFLADLLEPGYDVIPYAKIPHFVTSSVEGHMSRMLFGRINGVEVMLMQGRFHLYEGYSIDQIGMPVRVMHLFGIKRLMVSNAAGGINGSYRKGDVMVLCDHLNIMGLIGKSPLLGVQDDRFGPRFFSMHDCYNANFRSACRRLAHEEGYGTRFHEGVYVMVGGPNFETPAELRFLEAMRVDAVGMSTVHEALVARQCGIEVFAFSLITNEAVKQQDAEDGANTEEIYETADDATPMVMRVIKRLIPVIAKGDDVAKREQEDSPQH